MLQSVHKERLAFEESTVSADILNTVSWPTDSNYSIPIPWSMYVVAVVPCKVYSVATSYHKHILGVNVV